MIGIIDYGAGNIRSVRNALDRLGIDSIVSRDPLELDTADKLILPGVGSARSAIVALDDHELSDWIRRNGKPLLGICLGMQLLYGYSDEGNTACLGLIEGGIHRFAEPGIKIPHIGWNRVSPQGLDPLFDGLEQGEYFYFLHSFFAPVCSETLAHSDYGCAFAAAVRHGSARGVQFHPEKSGEAGLRLLSNFIALC